jgi:hypothetical protein
MMSASYLDVLPAHPQPEPLESLNSYIKRLAAANRIQHIHNFAHLAAIREPRFLFDNMPLPSFGRLAAIAGCTDAHLLALTFYHLGHKFSRATRTLRSFLSDSIVSHSRYCPHCLADQGYHALAWSFPHLVGCPTHAVYLLEHCGHCGATIPLNSTFLSVTHCPSCKNDLRACSTRSLSMADRQTCLQHWNDLVYLLTPQPWEEHGYEVAAGARQRLGFVRLEKRWGGKQVANQLNRRAEIIFAMENAARSGRGESFQDYLRYADLLQVTLSAQFMDAENTGYKTKARLHQEVLEAKVREAIEILESQGGSITQESVSQLVGFRSGTLRSYSDIYARLPQAELERQTCHRQTTNEPKLYAAVQQAIQQLTSRGERISWNAIGLLVGHARTCLTYYPQVAALVKSAIEDYDRQQQRYETDLVDTVRQAIATFAERGEPVTYKAIAQYVGIPRNRFDTRPQLVAVVSEAIQQTKAQQMRERAARMKATFVSLKQRGIPLTQHVLAAESGTPRTALQVDPELRAVWASLADDYARQKEDRLVKQVEEAIQQLEAQQLPVSLRAIARRVGLSRKPLLQYPRVFRIAQAYHLVRQPDLEPDALSETANGRM